MLNPNQVFLLAQKVEIGPKDFTLGIRRKEKKKIQSAPSY
jgi:hypothetical protein